MTFGEALLAARKRANIGQVALGKVVGIGQTAISQVERGERSGFARETVAKIEAALGLPPGELAQHLPDEHAARVLAMSVLPLVGVVSAGDGSEDEYPPGTTLTVSGLYPPGTVAYRVKGVSMEDALIGDGDYVLVRGTPEGASGETVVVYYPDRGTLVKLKRKTHYAGANKRQPRDPLPFVDGVKEYGVLVGVIRKC